jgi:hypothetical protein
MTTPLLHPALLLALASASPALAQNALGDGHALDHALHQNSGGRNNQVRDLNAEIRYRNAIITGNAPNGQSFRGDVGYTDPGAFRSHAGSDDLFAFRRDSLYSGLAGQGIRGTEALQYQFALTTGSRPPGGLVGPLAVARDSQATSAAAILDNGPLPTGPRNPQTRAIVARDQADPLADDRGAGLWALRSTSSYIADRGLQPSMLGVGSNQQGDQIALTASGLRGVSTYNLSRTLSEPINPAQPPRVNPEVVSGVPPATPVLPVTPNVPGAKAPGTPEAPHTTANGPQRVDTALNTQAQSTAFQAVIERLQAFPIPPATPSTPPAADTAPGATPNTQPGAQPGNSPIPPDQVGNPAWQRRIDELRQQFNQSQPGAPQGSPNQNQNQNQNKGDGQDQKDGTKSDIDPGTVDMIRQSGGTLKSLSPTGSNVDAYSEHMRHAQELITAGRLFDAEERFTRALAIRPGDLAASVGRVHAQLGAGMLLSASINVRNLFTEHPEVAGVKYAQNLLPTKERAEVSLERLRAGNDPTKPGGGLPRQASLLIAYIGFQYNDPAALKEGLDNLSKTAQTPAETKFADFLRALWTHPTTPSEPAPQPDPAK